MDSSTSSRQCASIDICVNSSNSRRLGSGVRVAFWRWGAIICVLYPGLCAPRSAAGYIIGHALLSHGIASCASSNIFDNTMTRSCKLPILHISAYLSRSSFWFSSFRRFFSSSCSKMRRWSSVGRSDSIGDVSSSSLRCF